MDNLSDKEMLQSIHQFVSQYDDFRPTMDDDKNPIIGYYNSFYHNGEGVSMVYKPSKTKKLPILIIGYEARKNGEVYVVTNLIERYRLKLCRSASIKAVYKILIVELRDEADEIGLNECKKVIYY